MRGKGSENVRAELGLSANSGASWREMAAILRPYFWPASQRDRWLALSCFTLLAMFSALGSLAFMLATRPGQDEAGQAPVS